MASGPINGATLFIFIFFWPRLFAAHLHRYRVGDRIPLFLNVIRPFNSPSETYQYYDLPYCHLPGEANWKKESLGEVLSGYRLISSPYIINFRENRNKTRLCSKRFHQYHINLFRKAISKDYCFQMQLDDLPFWGFVGKVEYLPAERSPTNYSIKYSLFTHIDFTVLYNESVVIEVSAFADPNSAIDVTEVDNLNTEFTYSVAWNETSKNPNQRMGKYSRAAILPSRVRVHWFSLVSSIAVFALCFGALCLVLSDPLNRDLTFEQDEGPEAVLASFRCPKNMKLLSAVLGTGTQLLATAFSLFALPFLGYKYVSFPSALVFLYAITSFIGGYSASSFYCKFSDSGWPSVVILSGTLFTVPFFIVTFTLNSVAAFHNSTMAIPFTTCGVILTIFLFLALPMLVLGGVMGYSFRTAFLPPRKRSGSEITAPFWYNRASAQMFFGGLFPFLAIVCEFHYLCATVWGYKIYTLPVILFVSFVMLVLVNGLVSMGLSYLRITGGGDESLWRCVMQGGSPAIFMLCYCAVFYSKSEMRGFLQMCFFFGYNVCLCFAVFLMLASVAVRASLFFLCRITNTTKSE